MKKTAPWPDFAGNAIKVGDALEHPKDKSRFIIQFDTSREGVSQWRAVYEDGQSLWLGNQIGDKGRAVKV